MIMGIAARMGIANSFFEIEHQPKGSIAVEIVPMKPLASEKPQSLVQLHGRSVCDLRLQRYLLGLACDHGVDGHADKFGRDSVTSVLFFDGQHGDVSSQRALAVGFQLAYYHADEVVYFVQSLMNFSLAFWAIGCGRKSIP